MADEVVRLEKVRRDYLVGDQVTTALDGVDLVINRGEFVAIVGPSGSGKSTLAALLPRFYELRQGEIRLDGQSITDFSLVSLRQQLALVSQHVILFNDTIANNIAYGLTQVTREQIVQAAGLAFADEFITQLPQGYDTRIGENGLLLSGGQRQRLAIARAILKNAPVLILDEATSALDNESERFIQAALEQMMRQRTTLIIAHRLSTVQNADRIVVLHQGQVVEQGTHAQLLDLGGHYAQLHQRQFVATAPAELTALCD